MRMLFEIDKHDYDPAAPRFVRPSVRGIIIRDGRLAMIHSLQLDYYKFPGGGTEGNEEQLTTLRREVLEEAGLCVCPGSEQPYGLVHRIQKGQQGDTFVQDNYYYLCHTEGEARPQQLDDYEAEEQFTLEWVTAAQAITANRRDRTGDDRFDPVYTVMLEREARVLEMLVQEGIVEG